MSCSIKRIASLGSSFIKNLVISTDSPDDNPAAGLSSGESLEMTKFLMKLDPKLAILLIEHDMDVVFDLAHTISVLHFGEVLETGAPEQIKHSQKVQEIYLGTG